jgi:hypothetical protein
MVLLSHGIYFAVLSALTRAAILIGAFLTALVGGRIVAVLFTVALALLMASLVDLTGEIGVHMAHMHLE